MLKHKFNIILAFAMIVSCSTPGDIQYRVTEKKNGETIKTQSISVRQPSDSDTPAKISFPEKDGGPKISTGSTKGKDWIVKSIENITTWVGLGLIITGIIVLGFAGYIPFLIWSHGLYIAGGGLAIMSLPFFFRDIAGPLLILVTLVAVVGAGYMIWREYYHVNGNSS